MKNEARYSAQTCLEIRQFPRGREVWEQGGEFFSSKNASSCPAELAIRPTQWRVGAVPLEENLGLAPAWTRKTESTSTLGQGRM